MPGNKPKTLSRKETEFLLKKRTRNGSATYAAVEHEHTEYDEVATPEDYNAVGNGTTDDTNAITSLVQSGKLIFLPNKNYATPGTVQNFNAPTVFITNNASRNGTLIPLLSVGKLHWSQQPKAYVFVRQDTSDRSDNATFRIDRVVNTIDGIANPKALRVVTTNNMAASTQAEWAISGELISYTDITGAGGVAISGVTFKYGLGGVFAGHFQNNEMYKHTAATAVTATVTTEMNMQVIGPDHPTSNDGVGNRIVLDMLPRTNTSILNWDVDEGDNFGQGEVGAILRVRTDNETDAYARYGIVVTDSGFVGKIGTGLWLKTRGGRSIYITGNVTGSHIQIAGNSSWGLVLSGTYSSAAIRIPATEFFSWDTTDTIQTTYGVTANLLAFYNTGVETFGINMSTGAIRINGLEVLRDRNVGWVAMTGTANENTVYDTATVTLAQLAGRVMALQAALTTHGLIGV